MNDYIINPMWFYWIGLVSDFVGVLSIIFVILIFVVIGLMAFLVDAYDDEAKIIKKYMARCGIAAGMSLILLTILPSKETMYQMMIAKYATYDNAQNLLDAIKAGTDYLVESLKAVK